MSPITSEIENSLQDLLEDIRNECVVAIKNKSDAQYLNSNQGNYSGNYNNNPNTGNNGQPNKI
jgi:hypothetical protein